MADNENESNAGDEEVFVYMGGDNVVVPQDAVRVRIHPSVTVIPEEAFINCTNLKEADLGEELLEIGRGAFLGCKALQRISIPSTMTRIQECAFVDCHQLAEIEMSDGLLAIESWAFSGCKILKRIVIPSTVTIINNSAFDRCESLEGVDLFDGLLEIGNNAFDHCVSLKKITIPSRYRAKDWQPCILWGVPPYNLFTRWVGTYWGVCILSQQAY